MVLGARMWLIYCLLLETLTNTATKFFLVKTADNHDIHKTRGLQHIGYKNIELKNDRNNHDVWKNIPEHGLDYADVYYVDETNNTITQYQQEKPVQGTDYKFEYSDLDWDNPLPVKKKKKKTREKKKEKKKKRKAKKKVKGNIK